MEPSIEKKLTELFLSNAELLDEGQSPLLTRPRRAALEALNLLGIPPKGPGNGDRYHYTDLRGVFGEEWEHYFTPSHPGVAPDDLPGQMHRMKFLNGFCCDARHLTRLADGVVFGSLAAAAREYPGLVGKYYNTLPHGHGSAVAELTAAFVQDGAFVYVPRGIRVELPFAVECGLYGDGEAVASFGRNLFIFEEGSQAQLVIDYCTLSGERSLACRTREIFVGSGARVEMVESCRLNERSSLVSASYARQQGDSVLHGVSVGLSAGLMRNEKTVLLEGRGAENHTNGLTIAGEQEHLDFATDIEHIASDCTSYQLFKGLAADGGTSVFSGRIYVAQDAQRTQAFQLLFLELPPAQDRREQQLRRAAEDLIEQRIRLLLLRRLLRDAGMAEEIRLAPLDGALFHAFLDDSIGRVLVPPGGIGQTQRELLRRGIAVLPQNLHDLPLRIKQLHRVSSFQTIAIVYV